MGIENYGRLDPATGIHTRVQDFALALARVFDLAIDEKVDFVIFSGDAYKTCDPSPTHQREFARQLRRLGEASIPIVLVVGNHDLPSAYGKATSIDIFSALELDATHVIRQPQLFRLKTGSGTVQIAGLPWPTRHILRTHDDYKDLPQEEINEKIQAICSGQIAEFARQLDPDLPTVLCAHISTAEATYSGSERAAVIGQEPTLLTSDLAHPAFDYVALGHVHKYQDLHPEGSPHVVYPGSLERINFGEERDPKGCALVTIEAPHDRQNRRTSFTFVPVEVRPFLTIDLELPPEGEDPTQIVLAAIADAPIEDAVVRLFYTQEPGDLRRVDLEPIHAALEPAYHLAGIAQRSAARTRLRRAGVSEDLTLSEALDHYIENREELQPHREQLQTYSQNLEAELLSQYRSAQGEQ